MKSKRVDIHLKSGAVLKLRVTKLEWKGDSSGKITSISWEANYYRWQRKNVLKYVLPSHIAAIVEH